jgi:hypothetical protein
MDTPAAQLTIDTPTGVVKVDAAEIEAWGKRMGTIGATLEKAQSSGDEVAMERAMRELEEMQKKHPLTK